MKQTWKYISRYEFTLAFGVGSQTPLLVLKCLLQTFYYANIDCLTNRQDFMFASGFAVLSYCTAGACFNYLWIHILGFFPPIPFGSYAIGSLIIPLVYATLWFRIPKSARKEKELKRRFVIFLVAQVWDFFVAFMYAFTTLLFIVIPPDYQPILGFICPLFREILLKIINFITYRAGGGRRVKMGKYFLYTASGSGSNTTIPFEIKKISTFRRPTP